MKVELVNYANSGNGMAIKMLPETDVEVELLRGIWTHGRMDTGHPCGANGTIGFYIKAFGTTDTPAEGE